MDNEEKIINLLEKILKALEDNNQLQENVLNLFKAYDTEEFLGDEEVRIGISDG